MSTADSSPIPRPPSLPGPPPLTGCELLSWIARQPRPGEVYELAWSIGRQRGYPVALRRWDRLQVLGVYRELSCPRRTVRHVFEWGG